MSIIDAHIHYGDIYPELTALLDEYAIKLLNICVVDDDFEEWRQQAADYRQLTQDAPQHYAWCTSFDLPRFDDPAYITQVLATLEQDFASGGAVACKVWKNIGLEVKAPDGSFFMVDDPLLDPIFDYIAASGKTLLAHIAEPLDCWLPLRESSPHYGYYSQYPQWHMYNQPDFPSHQTLIAARDRRLARHPNLCVVGAHLGSLEYDVAEVAARLERYPNFAVDTSARLADLAFQDSAKVRRFFIDYQERILFGTDVVLGQKPSTLSPAERTAALADLRQTYQTHFAYFESDGLVTVRGRQVQGLGLPPEVLQKIYYDNARAWYPGL